MAAANYLPSEDQFLCSICLDVFTDPVTTPCGHKFCKNCITEHWNTNDQYLCPMCEKVFNTRPELHVNTFISEMVAQFRQSAQQKASSSSSEQQVSKPGEVPCDVCTGTKLKALKSCVVCLASYCETHLEPHLTASRLKRHQLIDPVENLEGRMCTEHDKPLELFCKTDQTCVCMLCSVLDHRKHDVVPLKEGYERKKVKLGKTEAEIQQMIQKRRLKIQEIKHSVNLMNLGDVEKNLPDNPERFSNAVSVLGKQSFSSGRFYFEVQVKGKTKWTLGVAREWINRKGLITLSPEDGYWTIVLRNRNDYTANDDPSVLLSLKSPPQKVGVFVDYEEGLVSFYDVDAAALIYSFTGCYFTEKLFPYFGPCDNDGGENSAPLIISPVRVN
uniref:E3 ubiquitin-protein ligase TRIM21-like n=1 Tax=Sander lucioperca TaxID=283035 RepID=A0A8C9XAK9_SANLU